MRGKVERDASTCTSLAGIEFLPAIASRSEPRYVLEVYGQSRRTVGGGQADDDAVAQGSGPVRIKLAGDRRGSSRRPEGSRSFAQGVLVDCKKILRDVSQDQDKPRGESSLPCS
jgi:hypothetical protein